MCPAAEYRKGVNATRPRDKKAQEHREVVDDSLRGQAPVEEVMVNEKNEPKVCRDCEQR
jgi:hypothetical protein